MTSHELYMSRCIELAKLGSAQVAPNPMVGAVLVHEGRIIGEGYHKIFGKAHAEVHCLGSVKAADRRLIPDSILYVSLEPCAHFGKTPPCTDLIIKEKIVTVVIGTRDPFRAVNGKGIEKLQAAGAKVILGVLEKECMELNKRFLTFHRKHRPYIILKWAETADKKIAQSKGMKRLLISNDYTNRLVHKWRSEEASILVGTNTALLDDPELTNRFWPGFTPIRLVIDMDIKLPSSLHIFDRKIPTILFNTLKHAEEENLIYWQVTADTSLVHQVVQALYQLKIQSVIVEGGAQLLQAFIDEEMWDEMRVIRNMELLAGTGLSAPQFSSVKKFHEEIMVSDTIEWYTPLVPNS